MGPIKGACLHWTADRWPVAYNDYHVNVVYNATKDEAYILLMLEASQLGSHVWGFNTGILGVTLCSAVGASPPNHYGSNPPNQKQIALAAKYLAELFYVKKLDPRSSMQVEHKVANADATLLTPTGAMINVPRFWDHQGWAVSCHYSAWRWDCQGITPHVAGFMLGYYDELVKNNGKYVGGSPLEFTGYM